ncbi:aldehyde dehydrogenase family protein [Rhodococcus sovatensis]|uniref:Aldehyde dehydrogenase family protein n=1 Tax=Rhodococcus sovatensis TaxID=1805840 RepID=A0ABZ2PIF4_9NOCA
MDIEDTSADDLSAVLDSARRASTQWARTPRSLRSAALDAIATGLETANDDLVSIAIEETRLTEARLRTELTRTCFQLRMFAQYIAEGSYLDVRVDTADPNWPMGPRPDLRRVLLPIGPVLVFAASNFPFAFSVLGGDTAAALAAGNAVIVKAHPGHPTLSRTTADLVTAALDETDAPERLLQVVFGTEAGVQALQAPAVKAAAFTGSIPGGRALFDIANARPVPIPFYGELGSANPVFVTRAAAEARTQDIVDGFVASFTSSSGQLCTKPGVLFYPTNTPMHDALATVELPRVHRLLNSSIESGFDAARRSIAEHADVETLTERHDSLATEPTTTLLSTTATAIASHPSLLHEMFGPAALVVAYESDGELFDAITQIDGQLTASIFGEENESIVPELIEQLSGIAGRVLWNQWPTGVSVTYAQQHGGPYPATTAPTTTSVGMAAIDRFLRPVAYQNVPQQLLPHELKDSETAVRQTRDGR